MKTNLPLLAFFYFLLVACSKDDVKDSVDCIGQSVFTSVNHEVSPSNSRQINFSANHTGDPQIQSVKWNFGDGTTQNINGSTASHIYTNAGAYEVKLVIRLTNGCSFNKSKNITVE